MSAQNFMTPKGIAVYPWLNKPDTKFGDKFKTGLRVSPKEAEELIAAIKSANQEAHGAKASSARVPYKTDEETGEIIFRLQSKYQPKLVDSAGQVIAPATAPMIWGGSTLRVKGAIKTYDTGGNIGTSLQIQAVQVVDLAEQSSAEFDAIEGGYVAETSNAQTQQNAEEAENDFDF